MVKIRCVSLDAGDIHSNTYRGISGESYKFERGTYTTINNREDAEYFLKLGDGEQFKKLGSDEKIVHSLKTALDEVAKELPQKE